VKKEIKIILLLFKVTFPYLDTDIKERTLFKRTESAEENIWTEER
jgi:hypothetical protein